MTEATNPGNNANYYTGFGAYPIDIDNGKYTTVAGEFQNSASPYGTFDQGGNVWEWNEAIIGGSYRGLRGGSFSYDVGDLAASSHHYYGYPTPEYSAIGFRVSEVPEPATMGDTNGDHIVDVTDYNNLVAQFGGPPGADSADFNYDRFVDLDDFAIMRGNFGFGVVAAPDAEFGAVTPEPATISPLALCGLAMVRRRKRGMCR